MKLGMLVVLQESGAFKVNKEASTSENIVVGSVTLSNEQCKAFLSKLGWKEYSKTPVEIIEKTSKFVNGLRGGIKNETILENTEITFQNIRKTNSTSCFDRIKLICNGKFDITVMSGMEGIGGRYGVYSSTNNFVKPVFGCSSLKQLSEWINGLVK